MELPEQRFADGVVRFVELCEARETVPETAEHLYRSLMELMLWVWRLPKDEGDESVDVSFEVSKEACRGVHSRAKSIIETQYYDHTWPDGEVTTGDTSNDLIDIYRDLKLGLLVWQRGGEQDCAAAVWQWRFSHSSHWGAHASGLCSVLQVQLRTTGITDAVLLEGEEDFFDHLLSRRPEWSPYVSQLPSGLGEKWSALLVVPSPTEDPFLGITLWLCDGDPSIGFGPWHTHEDSLEEMWSLVRAIEEGQFVVATDVGGEFDGTRGVVDLREEDAILEYLTGRSGPPSVRIKSFSGTGDRDYP